MQFTKHETKSGAPLWLFSVPHAQSVAAGVLVFAGTRDEVWPKEAGIAHALEHMHFQGTKEFPTSKDVSEFIEEIGGRLNAWTWKEMTFYHAQTPVEYAKRIPKLLSEQMFFSTFPEEKIQVEMKNIVQEIRRRNDSPGRLIGDIALQHLYGKHPLSKDTLGTEDSVMGFTKSDFLGFKERYYQPANFVFVVAGNIDGAKAVELFDEYFTNGGGVKNSRTPVPFEATSERNYVEKRDIEQLHLVMSAPVGASNDQTTQHLSLFGTMISGGMSFPLFQEVRDKLGLCYEIHASVEKLSDVGFFGVYIGTDHKRYKEAIEATQEVIAKSKTDEQLLKKAKDVKLGRLALTFESMDDVIDIAAFDIASLGAPRGYEEIKKEIEAIQIGDITRAVDTYLAPEKLYTSMLVPRGFEE